MNNIEILEDYIEALRKPKSFKYTNEQKAQAIENLLFELKGTKIDLKLQETENENLIQENKELKEKYNRLSHFAIETIFSEFNDDVELLARFLYKEGFINRTKTHYIRKGE